MALKDADLDVAISDSGSTKDASWGAVQKIEAVDMDMGKNVSRLFVSLDANLLWFMIVCGLCR